LKTTDGDTGQTGPEMAEQMSIPHVCYVNEVSEILGNKVILKRIMDEGVETLEAPLPLLITVSKDINQPRLATLRGRLKAKRAEIKEITHEDLDILPEKIGLEGSFTQVVKIFEPETHEAGEVIDGSIDEIVDAIFRKLLECKVV